MLAKRLVMGNLKGEGPARLVAAAAKEGLARAKFLMPLLCKNAGQLSVDVNRPPRPPAAQLGSIGRWGRRGLREGAAANLLNILPDI